jgi:hypothetical protein
MAHVALFLRDFKLGTRVAEQLTLHSHEVTFCEEIESIPPSAIVAVVNLNDAHFGEIGFVQKLKTLRPQMRIIGVLTRLQKKQLAAYREAGCALLLPRRSVVRNLPTLITKLDE